MATKKTWGYGESLTRAERREWNKRTDALLAERAAKPQSPVTAQLLATLIRQNCAAHLDGDMPRAAWEAEQRRLWDLAERRKVAQQVRQLLDPWRVK